MKKLLLTFLLLGLTFNCYALDTLPGEDYKAEASSLNEELRKSSQDIKNNTANITSTTTTANTKYIYFLIPDDTLTIGTDKLGRIYMDFAGTVQVADASVKTAPTGADLILDINKNGTSLGATVTIVATANTGTQSGFTTTTFASGDYFTIDIDQVGSTIAGAKLVIRLKVVKT